jgi:hypothetical protein
MAATNGESSGKTYNRSNFGSTYQSEATVTYVDIKKIEGNLTFLQVLWTL